MAIKHSLLASAYPPLKIYSSLKRTIRGARSARLRVLLYHDIDPSLESSFEAQLRWLSKSWQFVTPQQFTAMMDGTAPVEQDSLLLTFDDGFLSNRGIADRILNPMGIQALFFIVSNFSLLPCNGNWRGFIANNIYPTIKERDIPEHWKNMSIDDLNFLINTGHTIGGHTANHRRLSSIAPSDLGSEIIESADLLELVLKIRIEHFAYTFGDLDSFTPLALEVARSRFKYVHTGMRGDNSCVRNSWGIRRDSLSAKAPHFLVGAFLEGGADRIYSSKLKEYESWGSFHDES